MNDSQHKILLFYKYVSIDDPETLRDEQRALCTRLGLNGRIIVAHEGINATFEGTNEAVKEYWDIFTSDPRFADTHLKISEGTGSAFPRLSVKVRPEIVTTKLDERDIDPNKITGKRLSPEELHDWFTAGKKFYIVDMRNDYEHKSGHFEGSVLPSLEHFFQLSGVAEELAHLKDETVLTVCTGGVRCEKASGFLMNNGFKDVYQLDGGIVSYMEKYPNQNFKGALYVFDGRITMGFNMDSPEHEVIGCCDICQAPTEQYGNCAYLRCNAHILCCDVCQEDDGSVFCSDTCKETVKVVS